MTSALHWTSADLEALPNDGRRYEIIAGDLFVSKQPHICHQDVCFQAAGLLNEWSRRTGLGRAFIAPGLIFAEDDDVAPDVVWISTSRLAEALGKDGKLHSAPELVIEVLSPGATNLRRDRESKLNLYSRCGVEEYWIVSWTNRSVELHRRNNDELRELATLTAGDTLESPMLPGFKALVVELFVGIPGMLERPVRQQKR
jgi:Uma2 family endonuclease